MRQDILFFKSEQNKTPPLNRNEVMAGKQEVELKQCK